MPRRQQRGQLNGCAGSWYAAKAAAKHLRSLRRRIESTRDEENWPTKLGQSSCTHNQSCDI